MIEQCYVLRSKPHKEDFLGEQLRSHKIEIFNPRLRVQPVNPRARKSKPYFPGYIFVHLNKDFFNMSKLQWIPGAAGLVSFGGHPAYVHDSLINIIRKRVDDINASGGESTARIHPGEEVTINSGPFSGYKAIFDCHLSGKERVHVLIKMLNNYHMPADISLGQIQTKQRS